METPTIPSRTQADQEADAVPCGVLGQIDDERLQLMGLIVRTHRRLTFVLGQELEMTCGIPLIWFDVLIHVGGAPDGRLTMSKLSDQISLTTGGVTRLVDRMADSGLVERQNCANDRRSVHVMLTPKGQATLGQAVAEHIEGIDRHLMSRLSAADRAALTRILSKLLEDGPPAVV